MRGGVEVFLRVREAKTKKNAILWAPNVTAVPARGGYARKAMVFLLYGKVTLLSITEYILPLVGLAKAFTFFTLFFDGSALLFLCCDYLEYRHILVLDVVRRALLCTFI
jgi:hypothetical protein